MFKQVMIIDQTKLVMITSSCTDKFHLFYIRKSQVKISWKTASFCPQFIDYHLMGPYAKEAAGKSQSISGDFWGCFMSACVFSHREHVILAISILWFCAYNITLTRVGLS